MKVYVLIREDQNAHGYVDTSIGGVFRLKRTAQKLERVERALARREGLRVCGDDDPESDWNWDVSWKIGEWQLG